MSLVLACRFGGKVCKGNVMVHVEIYLFLIALFNNQRNNRGTETSFSLLRFSNRTFYKN